MFQIKCANDDNLGGKGQFAVWYFDASFGVVGARRVSDDDLRFRSDSDFKGFSTGNCSSLQVAPRKFCMQVWYARMFGVWYYSVGTEASIWC